MSCDHTTMHIDRSVIMYTCVYNQTKMIELFIFVIIFDKNVIPHRKYKYPYETTIILVYAYKLN